MNDLDSKIAEGIDDEALFRLAEGEAREFSPEYRQSVERLYRRAGAHPKRRMRPIRRIIAFAAIVAVLTGAAAAATFWEEIQQFFVTTFGQYVELQVDPNKEIRQESFEAIPEDWDSFWYPEEICDYSLLEVAATNNQKVITFQKEKEELKLYQWDEKKHINTDNEAEVIPGIFIDGKEIYATEKDIDGTTHRTIFWIKQDVSFSLRGALQFSELRKIAESLVLIER